MTKKENAQITELTELVKKEAEETLKLAEAVIELRKAIIQMNCEIISKINTNRKVV